MACAVLLLAGCASVPSQPDGLYSHAVRSRLYDIKSWRLEGRVAIASARDSWTANIDWDHLPDLEKIRLSGPLGQGAVAIELDDKGVKIDRGGGNIQSSTEPQAFINQQLGLSVPLQSLRFWAIGLPEAGAPYQETVDGFVQDGWLVAYKEIQKAGNEMLPRKMAVSNAHVKLKLIIDQWELNGGKFD